MCDWKKLYPFDSRYLDVPISETSPDLVRMHYVEQGDRHAEQTVLCVHGNPTWSFTFRSVLRGIRSEARVIAVDHIGCGLSDKPQDYDYCLERHIGNLTRLIEQLDLQRVTLLVHDWGGAIGFGAAIRQPARIEKFVVLNTAAFPPPYVPWRIAVCRTPVLGNFAIRGLNLFARAALSMALNRLPALPPEVTHGLLAPYKNWHDRIAIASFVQDIPRRKTQRTWRLLASIEQNLKLFSNRPVHLVWGMQDWCFRPECLERFEKHFPQAQTIRLEDVGHYVMEEAPVEVLQQLRQCLAE